MPVFLLLVVALLAFHVSANEAPEEAEPLVPELQNLGLLGTLTGDIELGFLFIDGNTDARGWRVNTELVHENDFFRNRYNVQGRIQKNQFTNSETGEVRTEATVKRYALSGQSNYKFLSGSTSFFGRGAYAYDMFGSFRQVGSLATGYANRVYQKQANYLDLETGPGFAYREGASGSTSKGLIWFLAVNFEQEIYKGSRFRQTFEGNVSVDGENSAYTSRSSLTAQINGRLAMRLSFSVSHNSQPEGNLQTTDTETSASLVYQF
jgi:putative salt-induced outer membrane protein